MKNLTRRGFLGAGAAVAAVAAMGLAGCGGSKTEQKPADSEVSLDTLIVGFDAEYPPYGFVADDGSYTGFDLELAQAVCEMEGWEFKAEPIDWDAKDALLCACTINSIWNGFNIEGREDKYSFTEPYMINAQVVVTKKGAGIAALADLKDKIVLTQKGSAALEVLQGDKKDVADTFKELQTIADYNNAFMQLESGAVDAVACDLSIAAFQMAAKPDTFTQIEETLSEEHYGVGFLLGDEGAALADKVTEDLRKLNDEGKVKEMCEKYADQGMAYENWVLD
ncbi:MAG: transporter substrate-binding domain-containing protein [Coriobacteriaceae bacterium]|nr:transporter substrate-binding domain-containing protein [Coriobacteriaceae bacterium]